MPTDPLSDPGVRDVLASYLTELQRHPGAEDMIATVVTKDFETGFVGGFRRRGRDGLRDFLRQRDGCFDEGLRS